MEEAPTPTTIYSKEELNNLNCIPDFEDFKPDVVYNDNLKNVQKITLTKSDFNVKRVEYSYECKTRQEIENLPDKELAKLCLGNYVNRKIEGSLAASGMKAVAKRLSVLLLAGPLIKPSIKGMIAAEII